MPQTIRRVLLCPNPTRDAGFDVTRRAAVLLRDLGVEIALAPGAELAAHDLKLPLFSGGGFDLLIVFGGDGTILHHAAWAAALDLPILGVNLGRRGFMSGIERDEWPLLADVVRGMYRLERRMMLDVKVQRDDTVVFEVTALNDAVISKGGAARLVALPLYADGRPLLSFSGDGVVLSTPTGSTAYSMAAGGPILEPEAEALLITPICAHEIFARPLVLGPERTIRVDSPERGGSFLSVDGSEPFALRPGDSVYAARSVVFTRLAQLGPPGFYSRIYQKFGDTPRKRDKEVL